MEVHIHNLQVKLDYRDLDQTFKVMEAISIFDLIIQIKYLIIQVKARIINPYCDRCIMHRRALVRYYTLLPRAGHSD